MLLEALLASAERDSRSNIVSDPSVELTYPDLVRMAAGLRGVVEQATRCDRVGLMMPSCVGFTASYFGVLWAGRVVVPLNFLLQPAEIAGVIRDAGIDTVFSVKFFENALSSLPLKVIYLEDLPLKGGAAPSPGNLPPAPRHAPDDIATILYTSGTSGAPKGVCLTHRNLRSNTDACIAYARLEQGHRFLGILPLFHSFGLTAMLHAPITAGASVHYLPRFSPASLVQTVRERRSSVLMAIASMYTAMARLKSGGRDDFASMIYPISGGEALPEQTAQVFAERFGVRALQGYGMTETSPVVSLNVPWADRFGSVGKPIPDVSVTAHDDNGSPLPPDGVGELWVRGPCVMKGYYNKPKETADMITAEGWLKTGDMGRVDGDGFVWITGRKKEMIIVGGENVYPREIESVLTEHPAVADAAVIGQSDPTRGETIVAFVTCKEGVETTEVALREFCRDKLAGYKVPRRVVIRADLPRGATGKILKRKLHELL